MSLLHTAVAFIIALGVLIVVHEYGHYLVARLCRVKVLRFSVGFGRPLFMRRIGPDQTEWVIAAIPFGGGSSVVRGIEPDVGAGYAGTVSIDLRHLDMSRRAGPALAGNVGVRPAASAVVPRKVASRHHARTRAPVRRLASYQPMESRAAFPFAW